jgi:hypothetical protein
MATHSAAMYVSEILYTTIRTITNAAIAPRGESSSQVRYTILIYAQLSGLRKRQNRTLQDIVARQGTEDWRGNADITPLGKLEDSRVEYVN